MNNLIVEFGNLPFSNGDSYYSCLISNQNIKENIPVKINGNHQIGNSNKDVVNVWINKCTVTKIPKGITFMFPNIKVLEIKNSKLPAIHKNDLAEYKSLEKFCCIENPISYLPGDLFEGFEKLEWIEFYGNSLLIIEPNILNGLHGLKYVEFSRGGPQDKRFSLYPRLSSNANVKEIKDELERKYPQKLKDVQKLENLIKKLKIENDKLKKESQEQAAKIVTPVLEPKSELFDDLKKFLHNDKHKDFTVKIMDEEIRVHKFLLAARSPILAEMLLKAPDAENLNLVEISSTTFKQILRYIYTDELPTDSKINFLDLFAASGRLKMKALQDFAGMKISIKINTDNVLDIFELSVKYGHESLKQKAFNEIKQKYSKFHLKDELLFQPEKLMKIVQSLKKKEEEMRLFEKEFETLLLDN
ncbi:unnamed protein product [Chironomus riparius]|uniref:BTB domain-containing protein n=1 Tax=Chironomus riparius TaxID=315576 RepID=A0A9N9WR76_9DIPT|nr:unnamed protein product [Chironomus riparius]